VALIPSAGADFHKIYHARGLNPLNNYTHPVPEY